MNSNLTSDKAIRVVVCGALGRMGTIVGNVISESKSCAIVGGVDVREGIYHGSKVVKAKEMGSLLSEVHPDVVVDFTVASAAVENVKITASNRVALVVGTTGFTEAQKEEMRMAIEGQVPAVISTNFSMGVNIFWKLIREAAHYLKDYDIEVVEAHHRFKKDAPSGTAKTILNMIERETGLREKVYGREGMKERGNEIGVHVIRGGDIVGEHSVLFAGNFECIELTHRAYDRAVFARGALKAVEWVPRKTPGIYSMNDVLNL